jgi:RimJ/RimL family protein N-acetyltransferase
MVRTERRVMISAKNVVLREKTLEDAKDDFKWESDAELARLDATSPISCSFARYCSDFAEELRNPYSPSCRFGIDTLDGKHIGNCAYYNISESNGETELGIMIGDREYWNKGYGVDVITALLNHIFQNTQLRRVYLKTLADNYRAQTCFRKSGFKPYVRHVRGGHDFLFMEIFRKDWVAGQKASPDK